MRARTAIIVGLSLPMIGNAMLKVPPACRFWSLCCRIGRNLRWIAAALVVWLAVATSWAGVGDPQLKTDHPWYPGELAMSTFDRLFATQAELYERVTGERPVTDEQKALATWLWRNTHYAHGEEGKENLFGDGFEGPNN